MNARVRIIPIDKRTFQLIREHGDRWNVIESRPDVPCFRGPGILCASPDGSYSRWFKPENVEVI